jgi:hypothetical protein
MEHLIVTVGGTGQMILHYYAQLYLLGLIPDSFRAVVLDADDCMASLQFLGRKTEGGLFSLCARAFDGTTAEKQVPQIDFVKVSSGNAADKVHSLLGYAEPAADGHYENPCQSFFSNDTLSQDVSQGLYARPCLSAVMTLSEALDQFDEGSINDNTRIVLVSSAIGGTGGGLSIPVLYRLQEVARARTNVSLRLVLLGQYFDSDKEAVENAAVRFRSNKVLFLRALSASIPDLHSFAFVEEPRLRRPADEPKAQSLAWCKANEPYWQAACALSYLLTESTRDFRKEFQGKEIHPNDYRNAIDWDAAQRKLSEAIARVETVLKHGFLERVASEPLPAKMWGDALYTFLHRFWTAVHVSTNNDRKTLKRLASSAQNAVVKLWDTKTKDYCAAALFPQLAVQPASVRRMREVRWPSLDVPLQTRHFVSPVVAHDLLAAATLFSTLRFGGR